MKIEELLKESDILVPPFEKKEPNSIYTTPRNHTSKTDYHIPQCKKLYIILTFNSK